VFGVSGVEFMVILLVALIVLGPEKLPDAVRKTGRVVGELRRMSNGFQAELRDALDEPYKEVKGTFDSARQTLKDTAGAVTSGFDMTPTAAKPAAPTTTEPPAPTEPAVPAAAASEPVEPAVEPPTPPDGELAAKGTTSVESAASAPADPDPDDTPDPVAVEAAAPRPIPPGAPPLAS
jgi:sec-independent protein translocase protein TatB